MHDVTVTADGSERIVEAAVCALDWVSDDTFVMRVEWSEPESTARESGARPGQFFLLRAWEDEPLLSRPMSVFEWKRAQSPSRSEVGISTEAAFLCTVRGRGTELLSRLPVGAPIRLIGPLGNGCLYRRKSDDRRVHHAHIELPGKCGSAVDEQPRRYSGSHRAPAGRW